jgi:atypical dual specificity phosphatase
MKPKFDSSAIDDRLRVGGYPQDPADVLALRDLGVTAVLNLQSDADLKARAIHWPGMWAEMLRAGLAIERVPIADMDKHDLLHRLDAAVAALDALLSDGHSVYLHCNVGINRSPTVGIAYYVRHRGMSLDAAATLFASRREIYPFLDVVEKWMLASR